MMKMTANYNCPVCGSSDLTEFGRDKEHRCEVCGEIVRGRRHK